MLVTCALMMLSLSLSYCTELRSVELDEMKPGIGTFACWASCKAASVIPCALSRTFRGSNLDR